MANTVALVKRFYKSGLIMLPYMICYSKPPKAMVCLVRLARCQPCKTRFYTGVSYCRDKFLRVQKSTTAKAANATRSSHR